MNCDLELPFSLNEVREIVIVRGLSTRCAVECLPKVGVSPPLTDEEPEEWMDGEKPHDR